MEKLIVCSNGGGIGNRLKGLISVIRIGKAYNRKVLLHWPKNVLMGCDFNVLFKNKFNEISDRELDETLKKKHSFYRDWLNNIKSKRRIHLFQCWRFLMLQNEIPRKFAKVYPTIKGNNIDFEYDRIPEKIKKEILSHLRSLIPTKEIKKRVKDFEKKNKVSEMVGIHIRRTDFKKSPDGRGNISTDDLFFKRIEEILKKNPKQKFFLCTDSLETEKEFKEKYGKRMVVLPKKNWDMSSYEASKDSFTDVLLLAKTNQILGTYLSTFTEIAWWFGGCKQKIEIIGDEKIKEKKQVLKNLNEKNRGLKEFYKRLKILKYEIESVFYK